MVETGKDAAAIVEEKGLAQVTDTGAIEAAIDEVIAANAEKVERLPRRKADAVRLVRRPGDEGDQGKANPALVNELLKKKLGG